MCGIAGYVGTEPPGEGRIRECLKLMGRRGPDFTDWYENEVAPGRHVRLLHSRLNIIDLDPRANQPFRHGKKVMAFNGELYNYVEVKEQLESAGHSFRTTSDTEVLLQQLDSRGPGGLDDCEGMWSFAMYDEENRELFLSRDRFGEKPLYIYRDSTGMYFGSEIKFISCLAGASPSVNVNHIFRYMINGYKALYKQPETFFEGVSELPAGSFCVIDFAGSETVRKYWMPEYVQDETMTHAQAVEGVREGLIKSVKLRLRADVPLAFCMSGGVDSNSLISIAKRKYDYDVHGFTIMNTDERYEEATEVEAAVKELGVRHTKVPITCDNFLPNMEVLIRQHDAPVYTISYYLQWLLMGAIKDGGYRISISGTAADELFTGYYDHFIQYLGEVHGTPLYADALAAWEEHVNPIVRNPFLKNPLQFVENPGFRDHIYFNSDGFAKYMKKEWHEDFKENKYTTTVLRNRMLNELFHESVPVILHEDDLNAMYFSIENRSPFLDRELFEFSCRIPTKYLMRDGFAKVILRDAMDGIVPDRIIWNYRKVGFNAPVFDFLDVNDPTVRSRLLDDGPIYEYMKREKVEELLNKDYLPNSESKFLFYFLNSKMFMEMFA